MLQNCAQAQVTDNSGGDAGTYSAGALFGVNLFSNADPFTFLENEGIDVSAAQSNPNAPALTTVMSLWNNSLVPAVPGFTPTAGRYSEAQNITITAEEGAAIYYTTDGSTPTTSADYLYSAPILVNQDCTIMAVALKNNLVSAPSGARYTIGGTDPEPTGLTLTPSTTALTGGGTVTLTVGGATGSGPVSVNCTSHPSSIVVSGSGSSVTAPQMTSAVNKADAGAAITVKSSASSATLPVGGMADAADNDNDVVVDLQTGQVILSAQAIAGMTDGASASSKVKVAITSQTSSENETISDLLDKGAAVFDVSVEVGGRSVHSFDGSLTITFTVPDLSRIRDPHILHILTNGTMEYYVPDSISGNTITVEGIRNLSIFAIIPGSEVPKEPTNPFADISESDYYYDAVLWAVANGVTNGSTATTFSPGTAVSRAQAVTFLYRELA